jgi:uncharacterized membrane protein
VSEPNKPGATWLLVWLSLLADVLGIFSFVGLDANRTVQIVAMILLGLTALAAAMVQLITAIRLSISYRGAYYQPRVLRGKILGSSVALLVAILIMIGAAILASESDENDSSNSAPQSGQTRTP